MFEAKERKALRRLVKRVRVKGFRKGRLPVALAERRYGRLAREDAREEVAEWAFRTAVRERGLRPISPAKVVDQRTEGNVTEFTMEFDVAPQIEVGRFAGFVVEKPLAKVSDEDVEAVLERLCSEYGSRGTEAGAEPDRETAATSPTVAELALEAGTSEEEFRAAVRRDLELREEREAERSVDGRLRQALIDANRVDPPESLVVSVMRDMVGGEAEEMPDLDDRLAEELARMARNVVRGDLLFRALAEREGLEANEAEISEAIRHEAEAKGLDPDATLASARRNGDLALLRRRFTDRNVYRHLREHSQIIEARTTGELIAGGRRK